MTLSSRTRPITVMLIWLHLFFLFHANAGAAEPYASRKERVCTDCRIAVPPGMIPRRGVVISTGSFSTPLGYWEAVDIDRRTLTRFITQIDASTHQLTVTQSRSVDLGDDDVAAVVALANAVWRMPQKLTGTTVTDVVWGIDLFDGDAARKEYGVGILQQGEGANLSNGVADIWQRLAR